MTQRYTKTETSSYPFDHTETGTYTEHLIKNCTRYPVAMIDRHGNKTVLNPSYDPAIDTIIIKRRSSDTPRHHSRSDQPIPIPMTLIHIPNWELLNSPVYVSEEDALFCSTGHMATAQHPFQVRSYEQAVTDTVTHLVKNDDFMSIRVFANDYQGKIRYLYMFMCNQVIEIPVTHFDGNGSVVKFFFMSRRQVVHQFIIPISSVSGEASDGCIEFENGDVVYISDSKEKLYRKLEEVRDREFYTHDYVEERLDRMETDHKRKIDTLKEQHKQDIAEKVLELSKLKNKNIELEQENEALKAKCKSWEQINEARIQGEKYESEKQKRQESTENRVITIRNNELQFWSVVIKIIGGIIVACLTWYVKTQVDKKK